MRNKVLLSSMLLACVASYAGDMGPIESYNIRPFVLGEAAYSWPQVDGLDVNTSIGNITSQSKTQGWGGRLAAGLMRQISEKFALSFEGGLMYNDHVSIEPLVHSQGVIVTLPSRAIGGSVDQYGLDLLVGIDYVRPKYDLFFKAGALFENMRTKLSVDTNELLMYNTRRVDFVRGANQTLNTNVGQVMPEIKLGGAYHFNEDWSFTAAWMHAFGGTLAFGSDNLDLASGAVSIGDINFDVNNPTINAVLFGIQYNFS